MHRPPPPLLGPGSRVALVSPSGPISNQADIANAVENAKRLGWEAVLAEHAGDRHGYLAGTDDHRVADLNRAAADPSIDGVWCVRGGYGAMRLLDALDFEAWRVRPKALVGYSDITALHSAIGARADLVTFHAPTARSALTPFSFASLSRALVRGENPCGVAARARTVVAGRASGRLAGGNLAMVSALMGTPYATEFDGAILVLEDVYEAVYRLDRMLTQLVLSGALARCAGIVFGAFTEIPSEPGDTERTLDMVIDEIAQRTGIPCIAGAPIGHIPDQWTIPLGARAVLDADARSLTVEL
jgi:muramoyltetrapeptide carboxypeptidase